MASSYLGSPVVVASLLILLASTAVVMFSGTTTGGNVKGAVQDEAALVQKGVSLNRRGGDQEADANPFKPGATGVISQETYDSFQEGEMAAPTNSMVPMGGKLKLARSKAKDKVFKKRHGSEALHDKRDAAKVRRELKIMGPLAAGVLQQKLFDEKMARMDKEADELFSIADGYGDNATEEHLKEVRSKAKLDREIETAKADELGKFNLKVFMKKREMKKAKKQLQQKKKIERKKKLKEMKEKGEEPRQKNATEASMIAQKQDDRKADAKKAELAEKMKNDIELQKLLDETKLRLEKHMADAKEGA